MIVIHYNARELQNNLYFILVFQLRRHIHVLLMSRFVSLLRLWFVTLCYVSIMLRYAIIGSENNDPRFRTYSALSLPVFSEGRWNDYQILTD